ncbi:conjugative transfer protein [Escherichia coli]|nr:conjugative transfer protein [Escherichia coli]
MSASRVKNGIKGEVVMRNGKNPRLGMGRGICLTVSVREWSAPPSRLSGWVPLLLTGPAMSLKWVSVAAHRKPHRRSVTTTSKRAEQYHPVIPIGAGNEVTVVFQDGFQLKTVEEMALERTQSRAEEDNPESPVPVPPSAESHLNGFNTDQMLKQLGNLNPQQFMSGSQGGGNDGK